MSTPTPLAPRAINQRCACSNMRQVTRALTLHFDKALAETGLRSTQFTLLVALHENHCHTLTAMATGMAMDRTTLTRNLLPLEHAGLIESMPTLDKRSKAYRLSQKGKEMIERCIPLWEKTQNALEASFGAEAYHGYLTETHRLRHLVMPESTSGSHASSLTC